MTEQELLEIEARANAATPGPWEYNGISVWSGKPFVKVCGDIDITNGEFIAHAREDVPRLLAEVARLRALIKGAGDIYMFCCWCKKDLTALGNYGHKSSCPAFTPEGEVK